jgi:hypothetical protein
MASMRWIMVVLGLLVLVPQAPRPVFAEEYSWTEDVSKQGLEGFYVCTASATANGNTGSITHNVGPDWGQPRNSEMAWQVKQCERIGREDVVNLFHYKWQTEIDPASVKVKGAFH